MVSLASRARTGLTLAVAGGTILATLLLSPPSASKPEYPGDFADDGWRLEARLVSTKILPGPLEHDVAVTIQAPASDLPVSAAIAIVIDRSGSMTDTDVATPMSDAKAAAARLVDQLGPEDAFAIITYSGAEEGGQAIARMARATAEHKAAAQAAIAAIETGVGTCISCGIEAGAAELAGSPLANATRRMVLLSDGNPIEGIRDRDELVQLVADTAARGISISSVGLGLESDELTMMRIAKAGRGNYYSVEDTRQLGAMFDRELRELSGTLAREMRLVVTPPPGVEILEAYGYPLERHADHVVVPVADMVSGEARKVVLRAKVAPAALGELAVSTVQLRWLRVPDGEARRAQTTARVEVVEDLNAVVAGMDSKVVELVEEGLTARAFLEANAVYEKHGREAAIQVIERRLGELRNNPFLGVNELDRTADHILQMLRETPSMALRLAMQHAYRLAQSLVISGC